MGLILDIVNFLVCLPAFRVTEADISRNLSALKKCAWFKAYYEDELTTQLIIHNSKVRKTIGKFNTKRITNPKYQVYCQSKLNRMLEKQKG